MCPDCEAVQRFADQRLLAEQERCLRVIEQERTVLIDAFIKHMKLTDHGPLVRCPALPTLRESVFQTEAQRHANGKRRVTP